VDKSFTGTADGTGIATVQVPGPPSGRQWIVWQISVGTVPARSGVTATITRNGRYLTSTIVGGGSSAQGPPALLVAPTDNLVCVWNGLTTGDESIITLWYEETAFGQSGSTFGLV
jgi:hypothetical protein